MEIKGKNFDEIYKGTIKQILKNPFVFYHARRQTNILQCNNISFTISKLPLLTIRRFNPIISCAEIMWIISGDNNINWLKLHTKIWNNFMSEAQETYGYRLIKKYDVNQLLQIIRNLGKNLYSRQQYFTYWDVLLDLKYGYKFKNIPCITGGIFYYTDKLNLTLNIRSSDVIYGLPYDTLTHYLLLKLMANSLGVKCGDLTINIVNAHVYGNYINDQFLEMLKIQPIKNNIKLNISWSIFDQGIKDYIMEQFIELFEDFSHSGLVLSSKVSEKQKAL